MYCPDKELFSAQVQEICSQLKIACDLENTSWFYQRGIDVLNKGAFWLLDRQSQRELNQWNRLCNGLLIRKNRYEVSSMPITNLYGTNNEECLVSYEKCDLITKIGGRMVCAFWPFESVATMIACHSNRAISTIDSDDTELIAAEKIIKKINFQQSDTKYNFIFQFQEGKIYLVGARQKNLWEFTEIELTKAAQRLNAFSNDKYFIYRPETYRIYGYKAITRKVKEHNSQLIIRDSQTGERAKVYIDIPDKKKIEKNRFKNLITYWKNGKHSQIISQYPATKGKFNEIELAFFATKEKILTLASKWDKLNLTSLGLIQSMEVSGAPKWSYKIIQRLTNFNKERWGDLIYDWMHGMNPKQIMEILELND